MFTLAPTVIAGIQLGIQYGPAIIDAMTQEIALLNSKTPITPEQQAVFDAAQQEAHAALQAAKQGG